MNNSSISRWMPAGDKLWFIVFMVIVPALFLFYGAVLSLLFSMSTHASTGKGYYLRPPGGAWFFTGIILSIGTAGLLLRYLYRRYLKIKYKPHAYINGNYSKLRLPGNGFINAISWLMTAVAMFFAIHIYDNYVAVNDQRITINKFLRFGKREYPLGDIAALQYVRLINKAGTQTDTDCRILFKDGYRFDSRDNMLGDCKGLINFLSGVTSMPVDTIMLKKE